MDVFDDIVKNFYLNGKVEFDDLDEADQISLSMIYFSADGETDSDIGVFIFRMFDWPISVHGKLQGASLLREMRKAYDSALTTYED